jgi:hypothetical protein
MCAARRGLLPAFGFILVLAWAASAVVRGPWSIVGWVESSEPTETLRWVPKTPPTLRTTDHGPRTTKSGKSQAAFPAGNAA